MHSSGEEKERKSLAGSMLSVEPDRGALSHDPETMT